MAPSLIALDGIADLSYGALPSNRDHFCRELLRLDPTVWARVAACHLSEYLPLVLTRSTANDYLGSTIWAHLVAENFDVFYAAMQSGDSFDLDILTTQLGPLRDSLGLTSYDELTTHFYDDWTSHPSASVFAHHVVDILMVLWAVRPSAEELAGVEAEAFPWLTPLVAEHGERLAVNEYAAILNPGRDNVWPDTWSDSQRVDFVVHCRAMGKSLTIAESLAGGDVVEVFRGLEAGVPDEYLLTL